jgi:RimJ/RimL family protein N-acetyltransferase
MRRPNPGHWIEALAAALAEAPAFAGCALRHARSEDEPLLFALYRDAMRDYVAETWGWDEHWQRAHFFQAYVPAHHAVIFRSAIQGTGHAQGEERLVGRICLTRHWHRIFLRDIELVASERNRGLGTAIVRTVLELARTEHRAVELLVLKCNPAQRLYARLGFSAIADDGARLTMRYGA